jgi:hypothetical protein
LAMVSPLRDSSSTRRPPPWTMNRGVADTHLSDRQHRAGAKKQPGANPRTLTGTSKGPRSPSRVLVRELRGSPIPGLRLCSPLLLYPFDYSVPPITHRRTAWPVPIPADAFGIGSARARAAQNPSWIEKPGLIPHEASTFHPIQQP